MPPTLLSQEEIEARLNEVKGWRQDGLAICRDFLFPSFVDAVAFVNRVAEVAEEADHHPKHRHRLQAGLPLHHHLGLRWANPPGLPAGGEDRRVLGGALGWGDGQGDARHGVALDHHVQRVGAELPELDVAEPHHQVRRGLCGS